MSYPIYIGSGATAFGSGPVTPGLPTGVTAGMILVLIVETAANEGVTVPNWTHAADSPVNASETRLSVLWRRATGDASDTANIPDPGQHTIARIAGFTNCIESGNPFDVTSSTTGAGTAISVPGDTTSVEDCLVLIAVSRRDATPGPFFSGWVNSDLNNVTELFDLGVSIGVGSDGGGMALVSGRRPTADVYGATTGTADTTTAWAGWTGALMGPEGSSEESFEESSEESEEPGSGSEEESEENPEVPLDVIGMDTWEFDSPEPVLADRDPIDYYLAWQMADQSMENTDKVIDAIRITGKMGSPSVQIHAASPGEEISRDDIETGTNPRATVNFATSTVVTRYQRKKTKIKNLSIWAARISGSWDGTGIRDRLDELVLEGKIHGTKK